MYLLPELEKLPKENDVLRVKLEEKELTIQTQKSEKQTNRADLMRLHNHNIELGLAVNTKT